ncbi:MAG: MFS transporter [Bacteroidota bacterium]
MNTDSTKFRAGRAVSIGFAHMTHDLFQAFLAPVLPLIIEKLHIGYFQIGILNLIQQIPSFFMPLLGLLADRMKLRYFVIFMPAVTCTVMSFIGLAPTFTVLAVMLFIVGISSAFFHIPSPVMMRKVYGNKPGLGMSIFMVGGENDRTLGPLLVLGAITLWKFEGIYRLFPFGIVSSTFLFLMLRNVSISEEVLLQARTGVRETLKQVMPMMLILFGITFFRAIMKTSLTLFLPTYLNVKGESLWFAGISLSVLEIAGVAGAFLAGMLSDFFGRKRLLVITSCITPPLMWLFVHASGVAVFPLLVLLGFFIFATTPVILSIVTDTDSDRPSFINSLFMTISFVGSTIAALVVGYAADRIGLERSYEISAFIAAGSIPFAFMLKEKK